jgi:BirA family biotin operon repressor/biotin-[acetyl-CoA-carboxylase] ligase
VLSGFERFYDMLAKEPMTILQRWRDRSAILGRRVQVSGLHAFEGVAEDVDAEGALLVRTSSGVQRVLAAEVSLREAE